MLNALPVPPTLTTIAEFPQKYLLENLVVRSDGSILVTAAPQKELWYVPPPSAGLPVEPVLLHAFDHFALGIVEVEPDVFFVSTTTSPPCRHHRSTESTFVGGFRASRYDPSAPWSSERSPVP